MDSRRAWTVLVVALVAYIAAVLQRTSIGVAGVAATERYAVDATALSTLAVAQIAVYAALQIPVGVLLDRWGPRALITTGALTMAAGQAVVASADIFWIAVVGRLLVGAGDALTFISVLRLLGAWFSPRRLPQLQQWVGTLGQSGQILSAVPFAIVLQSSGWPAAFGSAAAISVVAAFAVLAASRDAPSDSTDHRAPSLAIVLARFREALRRPGTALGFWAHAVLQSSGTVVLLLWGFPALSVGLGYGPAMTSALLVLIVLTGVIVGPLIGIASARFPYRRSSLVLAIVGLMAAAWAVVLLWPGTPPLAAVLVLLIAIAVGGPASLIGFDFARTFNPVSAHGSASGIVNTGGFLLSLVMLLAVGLVLDLQSDSRVPEVLYRWDAFRWAFAVQFPIVGAGVIALLAARRRTRLRLHEEEGIAVAPLWVALVRRWRSRQGDEG